MTKSATRQAVQNALQHARPSGTGWWRTNCPECLARTGKSDYKQALAINVHSGVFKCWKCSLTGALKSAPQPPSQDQEVVKAEMDMPPGFVYLFTPDGQSESFTPARQYAAKRVPESLWMQTGIGACITGKFAGRVIIPIMDEDDHNWLGWVGRTWYPSEKAYTYPKGMDRESMLYNAKALRVKTDEPLLVVEGVFDALHLWPHSVAILGKASESQMDALMTAKRPVVIVLDGDAWVEAYAMATRLRLRGKAAGYVRLPPKLDPDEVPREWLAEEVARAL